MIENKKYNFNNIIEFIKPQIINVDNFNNVRLKDEVIILCENCKKEHSCVKRHLILSFIKRFNNKNTNYKKCCSNRCSNILNGLKISEIRCCVNCKKQFESDGDKKFCSHRCGAIYNNARRVLSEETINKLRIGAILWNRQNNKSKYKRDENRLYFLKCKTCHKEFKNKRYGIKNCSPECYAIDRKNFGRKGALAQYNSIHRKTGRSYNEMYFYQLVKEKFPDALNNKFIFNGYDADVIIPSLKLAIHWNGIWHYKSVISELHFNSIQEKDKLRYNEIEKAGYTNYIIKDIKSCKNYELVKEELKKFLTQYIP